MARGAVVRRLEDRVLADRELADREPRLPLVDFFLLTALNHLRERTENGKQHNATRYN